MRPSSKWHFYSEVGTIVIPSFTDEETMVLRGQELSVSYVACK